MTSSRSAFILLVALCALVAACDSAEPEAPAFVGTWTAYSYGSDTYATLSGSQMALDPFSPAVGEVRVEGASPGVLRYVTSRSVSRDFGETSVSYTLSNAPLPNPGTPFVVLGGSSQWASLGVYTRAGEEGTAYFAQVPLTAPPVSQSGDTLRVGPNVYVESSGTGASVTVQGSLVLPRRRIEAGVETHITQAASVVNRDAFTRTIRPDGTFLDAGPSMAPRSGTWSAGPDSTVAFSFEVGNTDARRYRVTGNTLRLFSTEPYGCDAACVSQVEDAADVLPGTVQGARLVFVSTFTRSSL